MIKKYIDKENNFYEVFNTTTGFYMRSDDLDTNEEPFMRNFPALIDVGIMGSCMHGKSGLCLKSGVECYQNGLTSFKPDMSLENYKSIIDQCKDKVFQFALGGRGDANKHKNFKEILEYTTENRIIPNYTTSGLLLTDEEIELTKKHCGAVAVSFYNPDPNGYTYSAINRFIKAEVKTNIHYVLSNYSISDAIDRLKTNNFPKGINAVIFLLHKPIGLGRQENVLNYNDPKVKEFFNIIDNAKQYNIDFKIGFDSCTVPAIINMAKQIDIKSVDTCEAGRFSCYIDSEMNMIPCSFDNQDLKYAVDLKNYTIQEAWNSDIFNDFRNIFKNSCHGCKKRQHCLGGCPLVRNIVLCNNAEKKLAI